MRSQVIVQDFKSGWFTIHKRCILGKTIIDWIQQTIESNDDKALTISQKMLEAKIFSPIENIKKFEKLELYRFYFDRDDIADNQVRKHIEKPMNALKCSQNLLKLADLLYEQAHEEDEDDENSINLDVEKALTSSEYKNYLALAGELCFAEFIDFEITEKIAFFLNVYQCMYIHNFLLMANYGLLNSDQSYFTKITAKVTGVVAKPFFYNLAGNNFTLDQIKHGMIRINKKKPGSWSTVLCNEDPKR